MIMYLEHPKHIGQMKDDKTCLNKESCKSQNAFCPFDLIRKYSLKVKLTYRTEAEPFFFRGNRLPMIPVNFRKTLNSAIHSSRDGRGEELLKLSLIVKTIKEIGLWKSNSVFSYLKML